MIFDNMISTYNTRVAYKNIARFVVGRLKSSSPVSSRFPFLALTMKAAQFESKESS